MAYKINTDNKTNNVGKLIAQNQAKQNGTASTTPQQTVQIKNPTSGANMTVQSGSQTHQNWLKNNGSAIDQSSVKTTYSTPDVYKHSDGIKSFDQNGQQTSSVSGYTGATTPSFNVSSDITNALNTVKSQEALMRESWANKDGSYNTLIGDRNKQTGQLINTIMQSTGGKATLNEIESILGRRLENQEMQSYREQYSNGSTLQQSQLNNLWEHDFATRNNGENYQYVLNYLNNGTGGEVLGQSKLDYLNGLSPEALAQYTQGQTDSLAATQNYFTQRGTGWTPEYVNNTYTPLPWGEIDAGDIINNGGKGTQAQIESYLWMLQNPNYGQTTLPATPLPGGQNVTLPATPQSANPINLNVTNQSSGMDVTMLAELMNQYQSSPQYNSSQGNLSNTTTQEDILNKYLMSIWNGGL